MPEQKRCRASRSGDADTGQNAIDDQLRQTSQQLSRRRKSEPMSSAIDSAVALPNGLWQLLPARPLTFSKHGARCLRVHVLHGHDAPKPNQPQLKETPSAGGDHPIRCERCMGRHLAPQSTHAVSIPKQSFTLAASCAITRTLAAIREHSGSGNWHGWHHRRLPVQFNHESC